MKIRLGFVSNSSSSSFICPVCNQAEEDYDGENCSYCDKCGNTFCNSCIKGNNEVVCYGDNPTCKICKAEEGDEDCPCNKVINYITNKKWNVQEGDRCPDGVTPGEFGDGELADCPICNLKVIQESDMLNFVIKNLQVNKDIITDDIKGKFKSYKDFQKFLRSKR